MSSPEEGWMPMDRTVSDAFLATGPHGYMEFGEGRWRMHYPDGTIWLPEAQNRPEGGCGFSWPLVDPNEEDEANLVAHRCQRDVEHEGEHRCACGSRPRDL